MNLGTVAALVGAAYLLLKAREEPAGSMPRWTVIDEGLTEDGPALLAEQDGTCIGLMASSEELLAQGVFDLTAIVEQGQALVFPQCFSSLDEAFAWLDTMAGAPTLEPSGADDVQPEQGMWVETNYAPGPATLPTTVPVPTPKAATSTLTPVTTATTSQLSGLTGGVKSTRSSLV